MPVRAARRALREAPLMPNLRERALIEKMFRSITPPARSSTATSPRRVAQWQSAPITWERSGVRFPFAPTTVGHLNAFIIVIPQYSAEPIRSGRADNAGYIVTGLLFAGSTKSLPDTTARCRGWMVRAGGLRAARSGIGRTMAGRAPEMGARSHTLHPRKPAAQRRHLTLPV